MKKIKFQKGFSLPEIMVVLAIFLIICGVGITTLISVKKSKELSYLSDRLVNKLEQAKINAISGRFSTGSGLYFGTSSFTYFIGTEYDASTSTNEIYYLASGYALSTTLPTSTNFVTFSRLIGTPQTNATVTISNVNDSSQSKVIYIGNQGDISVIK